MNPLSFYRGPKKKVNGGKEDDLAGNGKEVTAGGSKVRPPPMI